MNSVYNNATVFRYSRYAGTYFRIFLYPEAAQTIYIGVNSTINGYSNSPLTATQKITSFNDGSGGTVTPYSFVVSSANVNKMFEIRVITNSSLYGIEPHVAVYLNNTEVTMATTQTTSFTATGYEDVKVNVAIFGHNAYKCGIFSRQAYDEAVLNVNGNIVNGGANQLYDTYGNLYSLQSIELSAIGIGKKAINGTTTTLLDFACAKYLNMSTSMDANTFWIDIDDDGLSLKEIPDFCFWRNSYMANTETMYSCINGTIGSTTLDLGSTGIKRIGTSAFEGTRFTKIALPETLETIGGCAFSEMPNLNTCAFDDSNCVDVSYQAFGYNPLLTSVGYGASSSGYGALYISNSAIPFRLFIGTPLENVTSFINFCTNDDRFYFQNTTSTNGTITFTRESSAPQLTSLQYSTDGTTYNTVSALSAGASTTIPILANGKTYIRCATTCWRGAGTSTNWVGYAYTNHFSASTVNVRAGGNIMYLLLSSLTSTPSTTLSKTYALGGIFQNMTTLVNVDKMTFPSTNMVTGAYCSIFSGCTGLTSARFTLSLSNTLQKWCYNGMFQGASSLLYSPKIIINSSSASTAPFRYMYVGCTSLKYIMLSSNIAPSSTMTLNWTATTQDGTTVIGSGDSTRTFYKGFNDTWTTSDTITNGIITSGSVNTLPTGWTLSTFIP